MYDTNRLIQKNLTAYKAGNGVSQSPKTANIVLVRSRMTDFWDERGTTRRRFAVFGE